MKCSKCGVTIADGVQFCDACGTPVAAAGQAPQYPDYPAQVYQPPQSSYQPPPQYQPAPGSYPGKGLSVASLVLGICGLVLPWVGLLTALVGLVLGAIGRNKAKEVGAPTGMATAGIVMSIIGLAGAVLIVVCIISLIGTAAATTPFYNYW